MTPRPNVLFLMSDEHRPDVAGFAGDEVVRTPVMDELARTGVVFNNCYTPSPICIPARQCLMAGELPKTCGVRRYGDDLPSGYLTWARSFSQHAYTTVCCGKLHHMGTDQMQGWRRRISFDDIHVDSRYMTGMLKHEAERYRSGNKKWSDTQEALRAGVGKSPHAISDDFSVDAATRYAKEFFTSPYYDKESPHAPLLLKVSLLLPHYPYFCDEEKFTYYMNRVTPFVNETVADHPFLSQKQVRIGQDASERDIRRTTAAYYGMVETIDAQYGQVMNTLTHLGQNLDDWIIIYTSDHGEMLGQHGIWEKQKFYEASARVPLIIRWPKRFKPAVVDENVNLCDLFATLCELADLPITGGTDSRSLVPLMNGDASAWNNETISQFGHDNLMIKRDHLKYQSYGPDMPEVLFNLKADPGELRNAIDDAAHAAAVKSFRARAAELGYGPGADPARHEVGYRTK
ncbi:MAG TPA: sulfatase-like hydrolase/transferase [Tepidisphaeraceae bacterium]|jgi:choline-sulfatase|nr:sulfatase-like hydrolase/transferase [Tepidisphaeraceae bacterium]